MQELDADIPKIAVMPQNKKDVLTLLSATEEMASEYADRPIITMSMAGAIGGDQYGITACLQSILGPVVAQLPVMVTIVIGLIVASLATNFCSNTVSGVIICSSCIPALMSVPGISQAQVMGFACAVIAICGTAICTLSACPLMGIVYSDIGIEYKGTAKYSVALCAIMILICAFILIPASSVLFAGMV